MREAEKDHKFPIIFLSEHTREWWQVSDRCGNKDLEIDCPAIGCILPEWSWRGYRPVQTTAWCSFGLSQAMALEVLIWNLEVWNLRRRTRVTPVAGVQWNRLNDSTWINTNDSTASDALGTSKETRVWCLQTFWLQYVSSPGNRLCAATHQAQHTWEPAALIGVLSEFQKAFDSIWMPAEKA